MMKRVLRDTQNLPPEATRANCCFNMVLQSMSQNFERYQIQARSEQRYVFLTGTTRIVAECSIVSCGPKGNYYYSINSYVLIHCIMIYEDSIFATGQANRISRVQGAHQLRN